jgi:ACR3 family arsenite transporter
MRLLRPRAALSPVESRATPPPSPQPAAVSRRSATAPWLLSVLFLAAIGAGSLLGTVSPATGERLSDGVDATLFTLLCLLFVEVRLGDVARLRSSPRFLLVAWGANFLLIPVVGFAVAALFLSGEPLLFTGLMIYLVAPCTDWFLGFTRLAGGNTTLGAVLLPINLISQVLLFPVFLFLFARVSGDINPGALAESLWMWFLLPAALALATRVLLGRTLPAAVSARLLRGVGAAIPLVLAALIVQIFAAHIGAILGHIDAFAIVVAALVVFFALTYVLGNLLSTLFGFDYPEHALLAMTTAARNAPLMLALTMVALPGQPLVYAAIVIGMLVEFPHLTVIRALLLRRRGTFATR